MIKRKLLNAVLILSVLSVLLTTCGTGSEEATISISFETESASGKAAISIDELHHVITLSGPTGRQTLSIAGRGSARTTVAAGIWHLEAEGFYGNELYSKGSATAEVKAGQRVSVIIQMAVIWGEPTGGAVGGGSPPRMPDAYVSNWDELRTAIDAAPDGSEYIIMVTQNLVADELTNPGLYGATIELPYGSPWFPGKNVTLVGAAGGVEIVRPSTLSTSFYLFSVTQGNTLRLGRPGMGGMLTIKGDSITAIFYELINVTGTLEMNNNVEITDTRRSGNGAAVGVSSGGSFIMNGGSIHGNQAGNGGAVLVTNSGSFTMNDGIIRDNTATGNGGGVYVDTNGSFTMTGGIIGPDPNDATTNGNTATNGGGVYFNAVPITVTPFTGGIFTMTGGRIGGIALIPGNIANGGPAQGGGVYIADGSFLMSGTAAIVSNYAQTSNQASGGGVYFDSLSGKLEMSGSAKITDNHAVAGTGNTARGGGVYFDGVELKMTGSAQISGNFAENGQDAYGGGVCMVNNGNLTMNLDNSPSSGINGNSAIGATGVAQGGGVFYNVFGGTFDQGNYSKINENTALTTVAGIGWAKGGGVNLEDGTLAMSGGFINGNKAGSGSTASGGGVYVNDAFFNMGGGVISGNYTEAPFPNSLGGGVYVIDTSSSPTPGMQRFIKTSGTIDGCNGSGLISGPGVKNRSLDSFGSPSVVIVNGASEPGHAIFHLITPWVGTNYGCNDDTALSLDSHVYPGYWDF